MNIFETVIDGCSCVCVQGVCDFDIAKIFDCGQCFRFDEVIQTKHEKEFSGVAYGRLVSFAQDGDTLYIYGSSLFDFESVWKGYLDIERSYEDIANDILAHCNNSTLIPAIQYGRGIRILAQDPFESIISFIISQNNNIPRIKKIIEALSKKCGEKIEVSEAMMRHVSPASSLCSFPSAEALVTLGVDGLFALKTGFRAKYIYDAATRFVDGRLSIEQIRSESDIDKAIGLLCEVKGIGVKVANCALLFGFGKYNAFPIDVWMKKVALKYFPDEADGLSWQMFGEYAGIAQQYLFYYERYIASKM